MKFTQFIKPTTALLLCSLSTFTFAKDDAEESQNFNIRVSPIHILMGIANVQADFGVSEAWTLGPNLEYRSYSSDGLDVISYQIAARANYYFSKHIFQQGWFIGPSLGISHVSVTGNDSVYGGLEGSATGIVATVIGGYQWMWKQFNMNLGGGFSTYTFGNITVKNNNNGYSRTVRGYSGMSPALEYTLGWKF